MARTELKKGDKVLYINGIPCPPTVKETIALFREAVDVLKIIAVPTDLTSPTTEKKLTEQGKVDQRHEKGICDLRFLLCLDCFCVLFGMGTTSN